MNKPLAQSLTQRLSALSLSLVVTLTMVGGIGELFHGEGHAAELAHMANMANMANMAQSSNQVLPAPARVAPRA